MTEEMKRHAKFLKNLIDRSSLPCLIPLIKIKDNWNGEERYFGRDYHDSLVIQDNQLSYYNLQCGDGTLYKNQVSDGGGFTFVCEPESYMDSVELVDLKEYLMRLIADDKGTCPVCGNKEINPEDKFCKICGKKLENLREVVE